ncbi:hypothetical protein [Aeromicrobium sp. CTD01-1L150]|uniref:hypothetical protein n=1 Tax=Aeromicrobium sp. CTD01-1L150 TaxID=3341830 RepID=UPI0035C1BE7B
MTAVDPSASPVLEVPETERYNDETTLANAIDQTTAEGPPGAPVTWRVDDELDQEAVRTVQHAFTLVELGWAVGSTPRPDLVSGLFEPGEDSGLAIYRARGYLIDGDPEGVLHGPVRVWLTESQEFTQLDGRIVACVDYSQATRDEQDVDSLIYNYFLDDVTDSDQTQQQKITKLNAGPPPKDSPRADDRRCARWLSES